MLTFNRTKFPPIAFIESNMPDGSTYPPQFIHFSDTVIPPRKMPCFGEYYGGSSYIMEDDEGMCMRPPPGYMNMSASGVDLEVNHPLEQIHPLFDPDDRVTMFIAGCQKCGKSYFIGRFIREHYRKMHSERPIYIVTGLSERDANFEGISMLKISTDPRTISKITLEKLRTHPVTGERVGALVVFDDIDRIADKKSSNAVYKLASDILSNGRDHTTQAGCADLDCIITNHEANDWLKTRTALTECNWVILFPAATTHSTMTRIIDKIGGSKQQKEDIVKYRTSRYLLLHKTFPKFCVMEDRIFLLD